MFSVPCLRSGGLRAQAGRSAGHRPAMCRCRYGWRRRHDPLPVAGPESATPTAKEWFVAGRPWIAVGNVSRPTMTVYTPEGRNTGAAVVVFPGGGYWELAIDLEGTEVCDSADVQGGHLCAAEVPRAGRDGEVLGLGAEVGTVSEGAAGAGRCAKDAWPRALPCRGAAHRPACKDRSPRVFRPKRAHGGGDEHPHFEKRLYSGRRLRPTSRESCRPDFAVALYPGHLASYDDPLQIESGHTSHEPGAAHVPAGCSAKTDPVG